MVLAGFQWAGFVVLAAVYSRSIACAIVAAALAFTYSDRLVEIFYLASYLLMLNGNFLAALA